MNVKGMPGSIVAGDTASWHEDEHVQDGMHMGSGAFTLTYELRGPGDPITLEGVPAGNGWNVILTIADSAKLRPGIYGWSKRLTADGVRTTIGGGQLEVQADFSTINAPHDGRTLAQRALADAEKALASFNSSGGKVKRYSIGSRSQEFESAVDIIRVINYWRQQVKAQSGDSGDRLARFTR